MADHEGLSSHHQQPWLHEMCICVDGNATALSSRTGDVDAHAGHGLYVDDVRVLSRFGLEVDGVAPAPVAHGASGATAEFLLSARNVGDRGPDPTVEVRRHRRLTPGGMVERVEVTSRAGRAVSCRLVLRLGSDGAEIADVKAGRVGRPAVPAQVDGRSASFTLPRHAATVTFAPDPVSLAAPGDAVEASFDLHVEPGATAGVEVRVGTRRTEPSVLDAEPGSAAVDWSAVRARADDPRLEHLVGTALDDLRHLLLRDPADPRDVFAAAGSPWYLTLFGRDSIWAARMMLPFGTELAGGTLRALARRQGTRDDVDSAEQPGKIPHELRRTAYRDPETGLALPPVYYGTVDATALWVSLLAEAWEWGLPEDEVRALLPGLHAAVGWLTGPGQPDEDGFLKYLDTTGTGLANQGWKDSGDSIRWRDGRIAQPPIALVEAQAYAVEALRHAGRLLDAFGEPGGAQATAAGEQLCHRIGRRFWVTTDAGRYLALALDGRGRAVDGLGSNMGHVLGTGVLEEDEAALVAAALSGVELHDEFGIRTLGTGNGGFNPIGYHTGSVWTHDTAIAAWGLAREGFRTEACSVARSLLGSAEAFGYRWPELYSGLPMMGRPSPYPASCRPQAWSAASAGALVSVALGLRADAPSGVLHVAPARPQPFGALEVGGLRFAGHPFSVAVEESGEPRVSGLPEGLHVVVE